MDISKVEKRRYGMRNTQRSLRKSNNILSQRHLDFMESTCCICHNEGCRVLKYIKEIGSTIDMEWSNYISSDAKLENYLVHLDRSELWIDLERRVPRFNFEENLSIILFLKIVMNPSRRITLYHMNLLWFWKKRQTILLIKF